MENAYPAAPICRPAGVARSSYYAWKSRQRRSNCDAMAPAAVHGIHEETRRSSGSRRMSQALRLLGHNVDRYRARSSMRQARLVRSRRGAYIVIESRRPRAQLHRICLRDDSIRRGAINSGMGARHRVCADPAGMALPGRRHGCVCPPHCAAESFSRHADTDLVLAESRRAYDHRRPAPGRCSIRIRATNARARAFSPSWAPEARSRARAGAETVRTMRWSSASSEASKANGSASSCTSITAMQSETSPTI